MAASPNWKLYDGKEYVASVKHPELAAMLLACNAATTVRWGHTLVVYDVATDDAASESYDAAAALMHARVQASRNVA